MSTSKVILFFEKCRLCLDNAGEWNIFEDETFPRAVYDCIGVNVSPADNLPQKICLKCFDIILSAKELRIVAMKNDSHIRALFDEENDDEVNTTNTTPNNSDAEDNIISEEPTPGVSNSSLNKKKMNSRKRNHSSTKMDSESSKPKTSKSITVRKDLFQTSEVVSSSNTSRQEKNKKGNRRNKAKCYQDGPEFECLECGKTFETSKKLYMHQRLHKKDRACPFDACGKMFATKNDLSKHVRTHTGEKPYSCDICDKSFTQQGTLKAHRENVHHKF